MSDRRRMSREGLNPPSIALRQSGPDRREERSCRVHAKVVRFVVALVLASCASGLLVQAQLPQDVGEWVAAATVADSRTGAAAVALPDGRTLIAGGLAANGTATDTVVIYDPEANSFASVGQLLGARVGHTATLLEDGRVLVAGGTIKDFPTADLELFDPVSGTSELVALMADPRTGHAAARVAGGAVLIVGGSRPDGVVLQTAVLSSTLRPAA